MNALLSFQLLLLFLLKPAMFYEFFVCSDSCCCSFIRVLPSFVAAMPSLVLWM